VKNRLVSLGEGLLAGYVPVIMSPSLANRMQLPEQISSRSLGVPCDYASDFRSHGLHIFLRWCDETLPILVAASMLSKEVTAILNLRAPGFFWRKYQSSFVQECFNEGCALSLQQLF